MSNTQNTLNVGIIGSGSGAKLFASAIRGATGFNLWSFYSRDQTRAERLATDFGAKAKTPAHGTLEGILNDPELHIVIVASPDSLHHKHVLAAAAAKKHVLVEKPMA